MYFQRPRRLMTNSSIDHQALLKTTPTAILTASGSCLNGSVPTCSPPLQCAPQTNIQLEVHLRSRVRGWLQARFWSRGGPDEGTVDRRSGTSRRVAALRASVLRADRLDRASIAAERSPTVRSRGVRRPRGDPPRQTGRLHD